MCDMPGSHIDQLLTDIDEQQSRRHSDHAEHAVEKQAATDAFRRPPQPLRDVFNHQSDLLSSSVQ